MFTLDSASAIETLKSGGYYTVVAAPKLRVIALNTEWGDAYNFYLLMTEKDHQEHPMLQWLNHTLSQVLIASHLKFYYL